MCPLHNFVYKLLNACNELLACELFSLISPDVPQELNGVLKTALPRMPRSG